MFKNEWQVSEKTNLLEVCRRSVSSGCKVGKVRGHANGSIGDCEYASVGATCLSVSGRLVS